MTKSSQDNILKYIIFKAFFMNAILKNQNTKMQYASF